MNRRSPVDEERITPPSSIAAGSVSASAARFHLSFVESPTSLGPARCRSERLSASVSMFAAFAAQVTSRAGQRIDTEPARPGNVDLCLVGPDISKYDNSDRR
jgi:hypothetical protein